LLSRTNTASTIVGEAGLTLMIHSAAYVEITDPDGKRTYVDGESGEYRSDVEDILLMRGWRDNDDEDTADATQSGQDLLYFPNAVDGTYQVRLRPQPNAEPGMTASAVDGSGVRAMGAVLDTSGATGVLYGVTYSGGLGSVGIQFLGTVGLEEQVAMQSRLRVLSNPAYGRVMFEMPPLATESVLEIFDIAGRRVDVLPMSPGAAKRVSWDAPHTLGGGVYYARLRESAKVVSVRFILMH
jgi:hypothetical protein